MFLAKLKLVTAMLFATSVLIGVGVFAIQLRPTSCTGRSPAPPVQPVQQDVAWDLTPPVKEPQYRHEPRYALLVFGPQRQQRVWMVLDGETLYVDRNGNGDLTEPDERLEPINPADRGIHFADRGGHELFEFTVRVGATETSKFQLDHWIRPESFTQIDEKWHANWLEWRWEHSLLSRLEGLGQGQTQLVFMPKPADAHVCALDGPLTFVVRTPQHQVLKHGEAGSDLAFNIVVMGRPHRGAEKQFSYFFYNRLTTKEVPEAAYLDVEIEYPAKVPNAPPLRRRYLLKQRC